MSGFWLYSGNLVTVKLCLMIIVFSTVYLICLIGLAMRHIVALWHEILFIANDNELHGLVIEPQDIWFFPLAFT